MTKRKLDAIGECRLVEEDAPAETSPPLSSAEEVKVSHSSLPTVSESPEGVENHQRPSALAHVATTADGEPPPVHGAESGTGGTVPAGGIDEVVFDPNQFWSLLELAGYEVW